MILTTIENLSKNEILSIIKEAIQIKKNKIKIKNNNAIANIFVESSTRTKISFIKAEKDLNMNIYNLDSETSSLRKKENLSDTIFTLKQYGINNFVIRTNENHFWEKLSKIKNINIINAGDGKNNHPTQALLDAMTIYEHFHKLDNLKILICGDIKNSRVYHSFKELIKNFNSELLISAPIQLQEKNTKYVNFNEAIKTADVVMMLRIQYERHSEKITINQYNKKFGINDENIKLLKDNAILMHPGPINRGIEISNTIEYENPKNKILNQVENGIYIRKVLLGKCND